MRLSLPDADLEMTVIGAVFGAVGTAGQRCTSTRRLIVHESVYDTVKEKLIVAYKQLRIGNPLDENNHVGPLIDKAAVGMYNQALEAVDEVGGNIIVEGGVLTGKGYESGCYVKPAIAEAKNHYAIVQQETFAPILYVLKYANLDEAINAKQCSSRFVFSYNDYKPQKAEQFLSHAGSDCGIANVNIGTSGAEIGGAFGGEKETVVDVSQAQMHGRHICVVKPIPLTTHVIFLWHKALSLICKGYFPFKIMRITFLRVTLCGMFLYLMPNL